MSRGKSIKFFKPKFIIKKNEKPTVFIDTFMWHKILSNDKVKEHLIKHCESQKCLFVITSLQKGEMLQRNLFEKVEEICKRSLLIIPVGRISANQIIHSLIAYSENKSEVILDWNIMISKIPTLKPPDSHLKEITKTLTYELNKMRGEVRGNKEVFISGVIQVEREVWKREFKIYWDMISEFSKNFVNKNYEEFFYSDYFCNLPSVVFQSYLLGYTLREREVKVNDIIDLNNISEFLPFTMLSILDKDQYNRLLMLKRDYPPLFKNIFEYVYIASYHHKAPDPQRALKSFLEWLERGE